MASQPTLFADPGAPSAIANVFADPRPLAECDVCGSRDFADRQLHGGRSTMRVCRRCERFLGFVVWHGQSLDVRPAAAGRTKR